jgi:hypothetical protein
MTLLMAALVLSASGCFNDEMSSPEGTVKGYMKAINKVNYINVKKLQSYWDPARVPDKTTIVRWYENALHKLSDEYLGEADGERELYTKERVGTPDYYAKLLSISNVKATLVSERVGKVWKGDKWHPQKQATVEVSYKRTLTYTPDSRFGNSQDTVNLVKLDNKWYIERWREGR